MENKVLLGMSGGVDSSVSALLLQRKGYEVIGITLEFFESEKKGKLDSKDDVKELCKSLHINHFNYDCKEEFKEYVIDDFINSYKNCKTPNPCIECNKYMKFGKMYKKAKELSCKYIATGHYAKTEYSDKYKRWVLKKSKDLKKDQSYVLWSIPKEMLENIIFPLADFESKEQIRNVAREYGLDVAEKKDSEDICFVPDGDYAKFLEKNSKFKTKIGNIITNDGKILGKHKGTYHYTIGQRRGLGISNPVPLFVLEFNKEKNEVIVGEKDKLYSTEIIVNDINLLLFDKIEKALKVNTKTRYSQKESSSVITQIDDNTIKVVFDEPVRAITPGQSAVFYIDDIVVGGGKIERVIK